jgi:hypothetical protein
MGHEWIVRRGGTVYQYLQVQLQTARKFSYSVLTKADSVKAQILKRRRQVTVRKCLNNCIPRFRRMQRRLTAVPQSFKGETTLNALRTQPLQHTRSTPRFDGSLFWFQCLVSEALVLNMYRLSLRRGYRWVFATCTPRSQRGWSLGVHSRI